MSSIFRVEALPRCVVAALVFAAVLRVPHADALELPRARSVPGGVALVDLGPALVAPQASADGVPVLVSGRPGGWTAVVGIPLEAEPGERVLAVRREGAPAESVRFAVTPMRYAEQRLKVAPGKVDLSPQDLARHERERVRSAEVIALACDALLTRVSSVAMKPRTSSGCNSPMAIALPATLHCSSWLTRASRSSRVPIARPRASRMWML